MEKKTCKKCGELKDLSGFYKDKGFKDGYKSKCKECYKIHVKVCEICSKEFKSEKKHQRFCSAECQGIYNQKRVSVTCNCCGKEYQIAECFYKGKKNHYCSIDCKNKGHSINMTGRIKTSIIDNCSWCKKEVKRKNSNKNKEIFCSKECYSKWQKHNWVGENHPQWEGGLVTVNCSVCGEEIKRKPSQIRENNYCSKDCSGFDRTRLYSGNNNHNWSGGITNISEYLRHNINEWKFDTMKKYEFKCDISGNESNLIIHHLYNYSDILRETFESLDIQIYENISKYTDLELQKLKSRCLELHYKYGLGVCITEEFHKEFHSTYGKKNNTVQQYEEFRNGKIRNNNLETA